MRLSAAIDFSIITFDAFNSENGNATQVQIFVFLLVIGCAGGCFVHSSLQEGIILRISYANGKRDRFPLREIIMQGRLDDLLFTLTSKLDSRIIIKLKKNVAAKRLHKDPVNTSLHKKNPQ